jgi:hypothetical protein
VSERPSNSPYIADIRPREQRQDRANTRASMMETGAREAMSLAAISRTALDSYAPTETRLDPVAGIVQVFMKAIAGFGEL